MKLHYDFEVEISDQEYEGTASIDFLMPEEAGQEVEAVMDQVLSLATYDQSDGSLVVLQPGTLDATFISSLEGEILRKALDAFNLNWKRVRE